MPRLGLRVATVNDAAAIVDVQIAAWMTAYRGLLPDAYLDALPSTRARKVNRWCELLHPQSNTQTTVAILAGRVVGFTSAGPSRDADAGPATSEIYALYVASELARRGIGSTLLKHATATLRDSGSAAVTLWVMDRNTIGRRFYEAMGWSADGAETTEIDGDCSYLDVRYRFDLPTDGWSTRSG